MRAGYKVAVAGLVVVLGCSVAAFAPIDLSNSKVGDALSAVSASTATATATALSDEAVSPASDKGAPVYADGVYRASGMGKVGEVPVTVTIEDGVVTDIRVGQNSEVAAMAEKAQDYVIPQILELQTTEGVDAASGATLTSDAIIDAVAQVLERASAEGVSSGSAPESE